MDKITLVEILSSIADINLAVENIEHSSDDVEKALGSYQLSLLQTLTLLYLKEYSTDNLDAQILEAKGIVKNKLGEPADRITDEQSLVIKIMSMIVGAAVMIGSIKGKNS